MPLLADPETEWKPCRTAFCPPKFCCPRPASRWTPGPASRWISSPPSQNTGAKPRTWPAANPARCTSSCRKPTSAQRRRKPACTASAPPWAAYRQNVLTRTVRGYVYVERTQLDGSVRQGLVGMVDLEAYSYAPGEKPAIRPSESTVLSRIPPRVRIRRGAPLETPHVMMLADDEAGTLVEPVGRRKAELPLLYEGELMLGGGHLAGWAVEDPALIEQIGRAVAALADPAAFAARWPQAAGQPPMGAGRRGRQPFAGHRQSLLGGAQAHAAARAARGPSGPLLPGRSLQRAQPGHRDRTDPPRRVRRSSPRRWPPAWPPGPRTTASRRGAQGAQRFTLAGAGYEQALALSGATEPLTVGTIRTLFGAKRCRANPAGASTISTARPPPARWRPTPPARPARCCCRRLTRRTCSAALCWAACCRARRSAWAMPRKNDITTSAAALCDGGPCPQSLLKEEPQCRTRSLRTRPNRPTNRAPARRRRRPRGGQGGRAQNDREAAAPQPQASQSARARGAERFRRTPPRPRRPQRQTGCAGRAGG